MLIAFALRCLPDADRQTATGIIFAFLASALLVLTVGYHHLRYAYESLYRQLNPRSYSGGFGNGLRTIAAGERDDSWRKLELRSILRDALEPEVLLRCLISFCSCYLHQGSMHRFLIYLGFGGFPAFKGGLLLCRKEKAAERRYTS